MLRQRKVPAGEKSAFVWFLYQRLHQVFNPDLKSPFISLINMSVIRYGLK